MTPFNLQNTFFVRGKERLAFSRLTLTLSARGWSAAVQWNTTAASGRGTTPEEAIAAAIRYVETHWRGTIK